jgi:type I restriction enzyme S subunit
MKDLRKTIGIHDETFNLVSVKDLVDQKVLFRPIDGNHGEIHPKTEDFVQEGVPFIMASDFKNGRINYAGCAKITERQAEGLRKGFAHNGDVLLTHKATIGETAIVEYDAHPYVMLTPQVTYYRVRNQQALCNRYLKYYFDSSLLQQTLHMLAGSGSTRAYLGITEQQRLPVIVPPPDKQRKIAAILSAYDDLIANNQRRIALLEGMAEEIYREWFVRMRFPGSEAAKFFKGVPESWHKRRLSDYCLIVKGKSYAAEDLTDDDTAMPFVTLKSFNRGGGYRADGLKYYKGEFKPNQVAKRGDLVMAVTDMTQDRVVVGQAARVPNLGERGCVISLDVIKVVPTDANHLFLYLFLRYSGFASYIREFANGANVLHLKPDLVGRQEVAFPPTLLQERMANLVEPMIDEAEQLATTTQKLAEAQSALLPRLISGKLKVDHLDIRLPPSMRTEAEAAA